MPDERISILGVLEGNLAQELAKVGKISGDVEKGIEGADKQVVQFAGRLKDLGSKLEGAFKPLAGGDDGKGKAAKGLDELDVSSTKLTNKAALLTNRLLGLQFAIQSLASTQNGMGQLKIVTEGLQSAMQGFAAGVSLIPGSLGLAFGGAGALILGVASALNAVQQQIDEIGQRSKDLVAHSNETALKYAKTQAQARVTSDLINSVEEKNKAALDEQEQNLRKKAEVIAGNGQKIAEVQKQEKVVAQQLAALDAQRFEAQKNILQLQESGGDQNGAALVEEQGRLNDIEEASNKLGISKAKLRDNEAALRKSVEDLDDEYNKSLLTYSLMQQKFADDSARKTFLDGVRKINQALRDLDEAQRKGSVGGAEADQQRLNLEKQKLVLMAENRRSLSQDASDRQQQIEVEAQQKEKIDQIEQNLTADAQERAYAEQTIAQYQAEQAAKTRENLPNLELMKGIAQGIGQQFAQATGTLIDGLVQGNLAFRDFAGQFLLQIAKMIAQAIILKAVMAGLGVIGLNGGGSTTPGFENNHYAEGGTIPGPNVNADVVPAMLTPGEYVIRRDAAQKYGPRVMAALNRGLIPPSAFGGMGSTPTVSVGGRFAAGGEVPYGAGAVPKPAMAFMVPSDGELDRLLAGGDGAAMRFFQRNRSKMRTALGIGGR